MPLLINIPLNIMIMLRISQYIDKIYVPVVLTRCQHWEYKSTRIFQNIPEYSLVTSTYAMDSVAEILCEIFAINKTEYF